MIGGEVEVRILEVRGDRVRLGILAPAEVAVHRKEVFLSIQNEMRAAAASETGGLDQAMGFLKKPEGKGEGSQTRPMGKQVGGEGR